MIDIDIHSNTLLWIIVIAICAIIDLAFSMYRKDKDKKDKKNKK